MAAPDRFALSPGLPLREGGHYSTGKENKRSALSECFADAAPDSWGRALMTRAMGTFAEPRFYLCGRGPMAAVTGLRHFSLAIAPQDSGDRYC
jgi:hypothetical protein